MKNRLVTSDQRRAIWCEMRVPTCATIVLLMGLAGIVGIGALVPSHWGSIVEFALMVVMVLTVLLFSMGVSDEPPLLRFFSALGFVWLGTLFAMTMVDYLTR